MWCKSSWFIVSHLKFHILKKHANIYLIGSNDGWNWDWTGLSSCRISGARHRFSMCSPKNYSLIKNTFHCTGFLSKLGFLEKSSSDFSLNHSFSYDIKLWNAFYSEWKAAITSKGRFIFACQKSLIQTQNWPRTPVQLASRQIFSLNETFESSPRWEKSEMRGIIWHNYKGERGMGWQRWSAEQAYELKAKSRTGTGRKCLADAFCLGNTRSMMHYLGRGLWNRFCSGDVMLLEWGEDHTACFCWRWYVHFWDNKQCLNIFAVNLGTHF